MIVDVRVWYDVFSRLEELAIATLCHMSRCMLFHTSPLDVAATCSPPEACYQDALRSVLHTVRGFWGRVSSELSGSNSGRIDFFVEDPGWRMGILREGERLQDHFDQFREGGAYYESFQNGKIQDFKILDFRTTAPKDCGM